MDTFNTQSTSLHSQKVLDPIIVEQGDKTRKVFIAELNDAKRDSGETVSGTLLHQRKNGQGDWENVEAINLNSLKGGQGVKLKLKSAQVKRLYDGLSKLYKLGQEGVRMGVNQYTVGDPSEFIKVPEDRKEYIIELINQEYGEEIWSELVSNQPDLATKLAHARIQNTRELALNEFETGIDDATKNEPWWQNFFEKNNWIFGYGLNYRFNSIEESQPYYGGTDHSGKGAQKGDFLAKSESEYARFTVLIEIKRPNSSIIAKKRQSGKEIKYRNGAYLLGSELLGGVSQLQVNLKTWQSESAGQANRDLENRNIHTVAPKGILIIGNTNQLLNDADKITTFELFRQGLGNVEIITYDELLERARFILNNSEPENPNPETIIDLDDLPF